MRVDISSILEEPGLKMDYEASEILNEPELSLQGPVHLSVSIVNVGREVLAEGNLSAQVKLTCADCLAGFTEEIEVPFSEEFLPESEAGALSKEYPSPEEISIFTYGQNHILEFDEAVRQAILLSLPMKPVCGPNCKGLCPRCGKNKNEGECGCRIEINDDRWAPLKKMKFSARPQSK